MTKLPILSAREIIKGLNNQGFKVISQKGSHIKMKKKISEETRIVIIPDYNEIPVGTLQSIIRQSGFTLEEFIKLF
jgi:predicted RNA binding protein YcfA (HicA-like mRNA interferase family)